MAFDFLAHFDTMTGFLFVIIFILFILSFKKVLGIIKNGLIIIAASVIFPIVGGKFLGLPIDADAGTITSFAFLGLFLYFAYLLASSIYKGLSLFQKSAKKLPAIPKMGKEKAEKKEMAIKTEEHATRPIIMKKGRKFRNWQKDYVEIEEKEK